MDPVTLIVTALAAGASTGLGETVSQAIKDVYAALKSKVKNALADRPDGDVVVERHEAEPDTWRAPLESEITHTDLATDEAVLDLAQRLLALVEEGGGGSKYRVDLSGAQGVQVGDHNTQNVQFGQPPGSGPQRQP